MIPDLDLVNLSIWVVYFDAGPVVFKSLSATISTIPQSELELTSIGYFIDGDKVVFKVELVNGWEVFVLLALDWHERISESVRKFLDFSRDNMLSSDANLCCFFCLFDHLFFRLDRLLLLARCVT